MKHPCTPADFGSGTKTGRRRRIEREAMERSQNLCDVRNEVHPFSSTTKNLRRDLQQRIQTRAGKTEVSVGQSETVHRLQRNIPGRSTSKNLQ
jgi:hypothetical protein